MLAASFSVTGPAVGNDRWRGGKLRRDVRASGDGRNRHELRDAIDLRRRHSSVAAAVSVRSVKLSSTTAPPAGFPGGLNTTARSKFAAREHWPWRLRRSIAARQQSRPAATIKRGIAVAVVEA